MAESTVKQISAILAASHEDGERIIGRADERAREIEAGAAREVRELADRRRERIDALRRELDHHSREIEAAYAGMIEALARTSSRLVAIAREADFSPPDWSGGLPRTVELRLRETRELTLRFSPGDRRGES